MSNEVIKETEETVDTQNSVAEETKNQDAVEASKEENTGVAETPQPEETVAASDSENESETDDGQNQGEMDFGAMLAQFEQEQVAYHVGETVSGKVVRVSEHGVLVDFGYKSEGAVALEEFTSPDGEITVKKGDDVEVVIRNMGGDGPPNLSYFDAKSRRVWDDIERAFRDDEIVTGTITSKTKGGLKVDVQGVEAFLPGSQIDSRPVRNLDALKGQEIETKVVKFSRKRNNIVLSRKVITDEVINKQKAETLKDIQVGYIVDGTVKNLTEYGAFVDIGGIDGLLHVTDMSWGRLNKPSDLFKVGDTVQVKILKLDREKEKVSLGYKQLLPDPWSTVTELYPVESKIKGEISSVTEYGAFVELEPGVEGLVHVSEMSWAKRMKHPKHFVNKGDEVEVQVLGIDPDERRISLGIKQLQSNPWDTIGERYQLGSKVQGKVRNLTDFGAFVEIEDGVDGLVHVSDISWSKKVKHPKDVLKKGQEVEAVVTNIDTEGHRLSLSIKELTPSAWESYTNEHKPGDVVKGTISRFAGFGVFVELAPDLEGLCHISELSDERIENPESQFEVGQELDFKILRIEHDVEKIGLSARAVGKEDEPVVDTKSYSSDAKGGMASLGELANLKFGKPEESPEEAPEEAKAKTAEVAEVSTEETVAESKETAEAASEEVVTEEAVIEEAATDEVEVAETESAVAEAEAVVMEDAEAPEVKAEEDSAATEAAEATEVTDETPEPAAESKTDEAAPEEEAAEADKAADETTEAVAEANEEVAEKEKPAEGKKSKTKKADS